MQRAIAHNNYDALISSLENIIPELIDDCRTKNNYAETCLCHKKIKDSINIPLEYKTYASIESYDDDIRYEIIKITDQLLRQFNKTKQIYTFLSICEIAKNILYGLAISLMLCMFNLVFKTNYINSLEICYIVGILSCVFLAITLELILREWKEMGYGKTKNRKEKCNTRKRKIQK